MLGPHLYILFTHDLPELPEEGTVPGGQWNMESNEYETNWKGGETD